MIPFYVFYSMFGFQRIGDLAWAAGDSRARGFLIGGTAGRTTLNGEGLQHEDGHSHVLAATIPNCVSYDPAYAYELAVIVHDGLRRMIGEQEDVFYYLTVMNENYPHPAMPEGAEEGILRGMHLRPRRGRERVREPKVRLLGSGTILREVEAAAEMLRRGLGRRRRGLERDQLHRAAPRRPRGATASPACIPATTRRRRGSPSASAAPTRPVVAVDRLHEGAARRDPRLDRRGRYVRPRHRRLRPLRLPQAPAPLLRGRPRPRRRRRALGARRRRRDRGLGRGRGDREVRDRPRRPRPRVSCMAEAREVTSPRHRRLRRRPRDRDPRLARATSSPSTTRWSRSNPTRRRWTSPLRSPAIVRSSWSRSATRSRRGRLFARMEHADAASGSARPKRRPSPPPSPPKRWRSDDDGRGGSARATSPTPGREDAPERKSRDGEVPAGRSPPRPAPRACTDRSTPARRCGGWPGSWASTLANVKGTGRKGRITKEDVEKAKTAAGDRGEGGRAAVRDRPLARGRLREVRPDRPRAAVADQEDQRPEPGPQLGHDPARHPQRRGRHHRPRGVPQADQLRAGRRQGDDGRAAGEGLRLGAEEVPRVQLLARRRRARPQALLPHRLRRRHSPGPARAGDPRRRLEGPARDRRRAARALRQGARAASSRPRR